MTGDRGSASLWVLAAGALVLLAAVVVQVRTAAVFAQHRADAAADFAALAAAQRIGTATSPCATAARVATQNAARVISCVARIDSPGRTGTVDVQVAADVRLPGIGGRVVHASARAQRGPPGGH